MSVANRLYSFNDIMSNGIYVEDSNNQELICKEIKKIIIPMIQRPYAQGRRSQEGLRKEFLKNIFKAISNADIKLFELNFIYGTFIKQGEDENVFELLDGQQRITTLFLLYYYISSQERKLKEDFVFPSYLNKFEYQTRTTSTDFITKLLNFNLNVDEKTKPSKSIRSAVWYSISFDKDTTVDAMIRMLDSIHSFYYQIEGNKPTCEDLNKIKFYVLELNGFGLTEELFIKMNARGLQLTPFENFKADLIGYMKKSESYKNKVHATLSKMNRDVEYWLNFSSLLDSKWIDLFWEIPENDEDSGSKECNIKFFRFIQRFFANKSILLTDKKVRDDDLVQFFNQNIEIERHSGFEKYERLIKRGNDKGVNIIRQFEQLMVFLSHQDIGKVILDSLTSPWETERAWQPWGTVGNQVADVGQRQMIILSAMTEYINSLSGFNDFDEYNYRVWMRFVHIMAQSTDINGFDAQITLTKMLKEILSPVQIDDVVFIPIMNPREAIIRYTRSHRNNRYLESEALKAELILNDIEGKEWEDAFNHAEKNAFMQGSCTFYYEKGMGIQTYKSRTENVKKIFDVEGIVEPFAKDFLLMRAVLCRNYDWTSFRKNAWNFTITNSGAGRFLRNLTIWNDSQNVKDLFCHLLDFDNDDDMVIYIYDVLKEEHDIELRNSNPDYWTPEAKVRLNKVYKRLYQVSECKALQWLYNLREKAMGCYIYSDGNASLYKGNVNCMFLGIDRHKYIPAIMEHFKETFNFKFADSRQNDNYNRYGNYSGDSLAVRSDIKTTENACSVIVYFNRNDSITLLVSDEVIAKEVFKVYLNYYQVTNIKDYYGNFIQDSDEKLSIIYDSGKAYYRVNFIPNADRLDIEDLINVIQISYDRISSILDNNVETINKICI